MLINENKSGKGIFSLALLRTLQLFSDIILRNLWRTSFVQWKIQYSKFLQGVTEEENQQP